MDLIINSFAEIKLEGAKHDLSLAIDSFVAIPFFFLPLLVLYVLRILHAVFDIVRIVNVWNV